MSWTAVHTFAVGDVLGASDLNTWLSNNTNFLFQPPSCRAYKAANLASIANNTFTVVPLDTELWKNTDAGMHSTVSSNTRIIAVTSGVYVVSAYASINTTGTFDFQTAAHLNGAGTHSGSDTAALSVHYAANINPLLTASGVYRMSANDYIENYVWQNSGVAINAGGIRSVTAIGPELSMAWISN